MNTTFASLRCADTLEQAYACHMAPVVAAQAQRLAKLAWQASDRHVSPTWCDSHFGTGARFLAMWRQWRALAERPACWHMVALLERPYTRDALHAVLQCTQNSKDQNSKDQNDEGQFSKGKNSEDQDNIRALIAQWPMCLPGQHRLEFEDGAITLTLLFGKADQAWSRAGFEAAGFLYDSVDNYAGRSVDDDMGWLPKMLRHAAVDAWWLSDRCTPDLMQRLRHCAFVETHVQADESGICAARRRSEVNVRRPPKRMGMSVDQRKDRTAIVVGSGLAGANVAYALARRGWDVTVIGEHDAHAGHCAAALTPVVARDDNIRARLTRAGALRAKAAWLGFGDDVARITGTVQLDRIDARAGTAEDVLSELHFPETWVRAVDRSTASLLAGMQVARGGAYFADGMLVRPDRLIATLLSHARIVRRYDTVRTVAPLEAGWSVCDAQGKTLARAAHVVIAAAFGSVAILRDSDLLAPLERAADMHALAGEVTMLPSDVLQGGPTCVIGGEGYILPAVEQGVTVGSTYVRGVAHASVSAEGQATNLAKMQGLLASGATVMAMTAASASARSSYAAPSAAEIVVGTLEDSASSVPYEGWAGWRAVVAGRLPMIGPLTHAPGVWLACAYGSRGLTWSALAGDMIAGALSGEPDILEQDLTAAVAPR